MGNRVKKQRSTEQSVINDNSPKILKVMTLTSSKSSFTRQKIAILSFKKINGGILTICKSNH